MRSITIPLGNRAPLRAINAVNPSQIGERKIRPITTKIVPIRGENRKGKLNRDLSSSSRYPNPCFSRLCFVEELSFAIEDFYFLLETATIPQTIRASAITPITTIANPFPRKSPL
jgi:hypothetical protein